MARTTPEFNASSLSRWYDPHQYDLYFDLDEALTMPDVPTAIAIATAPSTESIVSAMPTVFPAGVCTVCMEDFEEEKGAKRMPCFHVYHGTCISTWLARDNSCPICRSPIPAA